MGQWDMGHFCTSLEKVLRQAKRQSRAEWLSLNPYFCWAGSAESCSIISRGCGAKVHALFSITQLFVRLFVRTNACSHAEAQRAQSSHRELCFPQNCIRPADNDFLSRRTNGRRFRGSQMAEMAEIFPLLASPSSSSLDKVHTSITLFSLVRRFRYFSVSSVIDKDNSHGDWREDIFYNGRNGNNRKRRTSENKVILV